MIETPKRASGNDGQPIEPVGNAPSRWKRTFPDWRSVLYAIVLLFVFIAALQLYFTIQDIIRTWISDQFVPLFKAAYYIVIISVGIWLIRDYIRSR